MKIELTVEELKEIVGGSAFVPIPYEIKDTTVNPSIKIDGGVVIKEFKDAEALIPIP